MVPGPDEVTGEARRPRREREALSRARVAIVNRIEAGLTVLGAGEYNPLRRDGRERLEQVRTALGQPLPPHARAQIERLLDRLNLIQRPRARLLRWADRDALQQRRHATRAGDRQGRQQAAAREAR